ncbi:hypothetical protein LTR66_014987, partial [Elasticomyces elasticus]
RAEHASSSSHSHEAGGTQHTHASSAPGTGPTGFAQGQDNDVPHFDRDGHFRTQESVHRHQRKRTKGVGLGDWGEVEMGGPSVLFNFIAISGALGVIFAVSGAVMGGGGGSGGGGGGKAARDREG